MNTIQGVLVEHDCCASSGRMQSERGMHLDGLMFRNMISAAHVKLSPSLKGSVAVLNFVVK